MKRIIKIITIIALLIIPQVKAITSDEVIYQDDTVTKALDELNICAISGDATADEILSGKSAYVQGKLVVGTIPSKGSATYTPSTTNQIISAGQYLSEDQIIKGDANLKAENIKCGVTIFGVKGTKDCAPSTFLSGLWTTAKIGDYVRMVPNLKSYTIPTSLTGYTSTQTINPSELKTWRIIRFNDDGTIEMVSEYVSSKAVYFSGETGYRNLVEALKNIASAFAVPNLTSSTRPMGYKDQSLNINYTILPSFCNNTSTEDNSLERRGCGDVSSQPDRNLVRSACRNLSSMPVSGSDSNSDYWLASRYFVSTQYGGMFGAAKTAGSTGWSYATLYDCTSGSSCSGKTVGLPFRPIVILLPSVSASSGSGTISSPWVLS